MISGFNFYIGFKPETKVTVVVLMNNFNWDDVVGYNLLLTLSRYNKLKISKVRIVRNTFSPSAF